MPTNTYQPNETDSNDTYISQDNATTNYGTNTSLIVQQSGGKGSGQNKAILEFDCSDIPSGSIVTAASLTLNATSILDGGGQNATVARLWRDSGQVGPWTEAGATWNTYDGSGSWTGMGASNALFDYENTTKVNVALPTSTGAWTASGLQTFVNSQINNGANRIVRAQVAIIVFRAGNATDSGVVFDSSGTGTAGNRPKLSVTYTEPDLYSRVRVY